VAKTIEDSMKELSQVDQGLIKNIAKIANKNRLITKRKITHINDYLYVRRSQIQALSYKLTQNFANSNFETSFNSFDSVGRVSMMNNDDFGNTLATIKDVLYDEVYREHLYSKENSEILKLYATLSSYLLTTLPEFHANLKKIDSSIP